jgi:RNA polymerase sigma factor (TIGR02999 family)
MSDNITQMLNQWMAGETEQQDELMAAVYPMLHQAAINQLNKVSGHTLNPTLLVNEVYLKLHQSNGLKLNNKSHFVALCSRMIRQILLDAIKARRAQKRGGSMDLVTYNDYEHGDGQDDDRFKLIDWELLNQLLTELQEVDRTSAELIELRFFGGLTISEIAEVQQVSSATISRNWKFAKSWMVSRLKKEIPEAPL